MSHNQEQNVPTEPKAEKDFNMKAPLDDFILNVDGKKLYVPKMVLMVASPVFAQMLNSDFKEKSQDELDLPDKKYEDILKFLECIHPGFLTPITMDNVFAVLPLANEYLVQHLQKQCEEVLCSSISYEYVDKLCEYLSLANRFQLRALEEKCIERAARKSNKSERSEFSEAAKKYAVSFESQANVYKAMLDTQSNNVRVTLRRNSSNCRQCNNVIETLERILKNYL